MTVREIYEELREQRQIAYTTVMTVLIGLAKKGLLARDTSTVVHHYREARPAEQVRGEALESVVRVLYRGRTQLAVRAVARPRGRTEPDPARGAARLCPGSARALRRLRP